MRVFVAGATGVVGGPLVDELVRGGHEVTALTRSAARGEALSAAGARPVVGDVFDRERLVEALRRARPEAVVNELTDLPPRLNPRKLASIYAANDRVRREGTANLLAGARASGAGRMIVQSAAYWYAPAGPGVKTEDDPLFVDAPEPIGGAVRTLQAVEEAVLGDAEIDGVVLRYGQFYGPGTWYSADGDIGRRVRKRMYPLIGDGTAVLSFVHVEDAARATAAALTAPPGVYNVVDDEPAAAADWMPAYAEALGAKPPRRVPVALAKLVAGRPLVTWVTSTRGADNRKAKATLDWTLRYPTWRTGFSQVRR